MLWSKFTYLVIIRRCMVCLGMCHTRRSDDGGVQVIFFGSTVITLPPLKIRELKGVYGGTKV